MPLVPIHSLDDPRLEPYRHLKRTNLTRGSDEFVVEGDKLVERLLDSPYPVASVLLAERLVEQFRLQVPADVPLLVIADDLVEQVVGFNFHRGALACGRRLPRPSLADFLAGEFHVKLADAGEPLGNRQAAARVTLVVCHEVQNPENLGAILRIAAAFGARAVVLGPDCADPLSRRVLRVSMGSALRLPLIEASDLAADLRRLRERYQFSVYATVLDPSARQLQNVAPQPRQAIVLGGEGHGLPPEVIAGCTSPITIAMAHGVDSLNVAVASGIVLHWLSRVG